MSAGELACTYACLALYDDGIPITAEKIATMVKAANVQVESYWPSLFAKMLEKKSIEDLIMNVGSGGGVAAPAPGLAVSANPSGGAVVAQAETKEEKKEDVAEESDDDFINGLFE